MLTVSRTVTPALASLAVLCLAGCATDTRGAASSAGAAQTAAMAATFRYMFADNASALKVNAASYCVGTGAMPNLADPTPETLAALSGVVPKVAPASTCRTAERVTDGAGRPSLIFTLTSKGCASADNCLFDGGYYEGNMSASGGDYRARRVDGVWQVAPEGPQAIS